MSSRETGHSFTGVAVDGRFVNRLLATAGDLSTTGAEAVGRVLVTGTDDPGAEGWWALPAVVEAVRALSAASGETAVGAAGRRCARALPVDEGATDVGGALAALDGAYRSCHAGDAGEFAFRQIGPTDGRVECRTPYPCRFSRALVRGVALSYATGFVRLSEVGACRDDLTGRCTYELSW